MPATDTFHHYVSFLSLWDCASHSPPVTDTDICVRELYFCYLRTAMKFVNCHAWVQFETWIQIWDASRTITHVWSNYHRSSIHRIKTVYDHCCLIDVHQCDCVCVCVHVGDHVQWDVTMGVHACVWACMMFLSNVAKIAVAIIKLQLEKHFLMHSVYIIKLQSELFWEITLHIDLVIQHGSLCLNGF